MFWMGWVNFFLAIITNLFLSPHQNLTVPFLWWINFSLSVFLLLSGAFYSSLAVLPLICCGLHAFTGLCVTVLQLTLVVCPGLVPVWDPWSPQHCTTCKGMGPSMDLPLLLRVLIAVARGSNLLNRSHPVYSNNTAKTNPIYQINIPILLLQLSWYAPDENWTFSTIGFSLVNSWEAQTPI